MTAPNQDQASLLECSGEQVDAWLAAEEDSSFIDVRRDEEWALARIPGSELLSPERCLPLPKERRIVFTCHTGVRSPHAARFLCQQGFAEAQSMAGGIEAWSLRIDSRIPRY